MVKAELLGNDFRLTEPSGAEGTAVNLHQTHDVGLHRLYELEDLLQGAMRVPKVSGVGKGEMKAATITGGIADVIE
jgi:hypothetical protein